MKLINELTEGEILELSAEEVATLINAQCVESGVRLLPPMPEAPEPVGVSADVAVYSVAGLTFRDEDDAQRVGDLLDEIGLLESYYLRGSYSYSGPSGVRPREYAAEVRQEKYWSVKQYEKYAPAVAAYEAVKKEYDEQKLDYNEAKNAREDVTVLVEKAVSRAREAAWRRERLQAEFREYVGIVGDQEKALACMVKASRAVDNDETREALGLQVSAIAPEDLNESPPTC